MTFSCTKIGKTVDKSPKRKKMGRPVGENYPAHVGLKMSAELKSRFDEKAKQLGTTRSELIRTLAEYWLDHAEEVYADKKRQKVG